MGHFSSEFVRIWPNSSEIVGNRPNFALFHPKNKHLHQSQQRKISTYSNYPQPKISTVIVMPDLIGHPVQQFSITKDKHLQQFPTTKNKDLHIPPTPSHICLPWHRSRYFFPFYISCLYRYTTREVLIQRAILTKQERYLFSLLLYIFYWQ